MATKRKPPTSEFGRRIEQERRAGERLKATYMTAADKRARKAAREQREAEWEAHMAEVERAAMEKARAEAGL